QRSSSQRSRRQASMCIQGILDCPWQSLRSPFVLQPLTNLPVLEFRGPAPRSKRSGSLVKGGISEHFDSSRNVAHDHTLRSGDQLLFSATKADVREKTQRSP